MMRTRWRASRTQTSIDRDGSAGRVGSSKVAVRPVARASIQEAFLHREVAGIGGLAGLAEWSGECDGERPTERDAKCDPGLERDTPTSTQLDPADPRLMDANARGQLGLCQPEPDAPGPDRVAERVCDRLR